MRVYVAIFGRRNGDEEDPSIPTKDCDVGDNFTKRKWACLVKPLRTTYLLLDLKVLHPEWKQYIDLHETVAGALLIHAGRCIFSTLGAEP